jgi:hypothetical protein
MSRDYINHRIIHWCDMGDHTEIGVISEMPSSGAQEFVQRWRDFDAAHPGCNTKISELTVLEPGIVPEVK